MIITCDHTHNLAESSDLGEVLLLKTAGLANRAELWLSHINFQYVACAVQMTSTLADVLSPDLLSIF